MREEFISRADAVVFMVDSADRTRFDEAKAEICRVLDCDDLKSVPILVLGNKNDKEVRNDRRIVPCYAFMMNISRAVKIVKN